MRMRSRAGTHRATSGVVLLRRGMLLRPLSRRCDSSRYSTQTHITGSALHIHLAAGVAVRCARHSLRLTVRGASRRRMSGRGEHIDGRPQQLRIPPASRPPRRRSTSPVPVAVGEGGVWLIPASTRSNRLAAASSPGSPSASPGKTGAKPRRHHSTLLSAQLHLHPLRHTKHHVARLLGSPCLEESSILVRDFRVQGQGHLALCAGAGAPRAGNRRRVRAVPSRRDDSAGAEPLKLPRLNRRPAARQPHLRLTSASGPLGETAGPALARRRSPQWTPYRSDRSLHSIWNETDGKLRPAILICADWTEIASYLDPLMEGEGHGRHRCHVRAYRSLFAESSLSPDRRRRCHHDRPSDSPGARAHERTGTGRRRRFRRGSSPRHRLKRRRVFLDACRGLTTNLVDGRGWPTLNSGCTLHPRSREISDTISYT